MCQIFWYMWHSSTIASKLNTIWTQVHVCRLHFRAVLVILCHTVSLPAIQQSQRVWSCYSFRPWKVFICEKYFHCNGKNCSLKVPSYGLVWMHYCREQNLRVDLRNGKYPFCEEIDENCNCWKFVCGQDFISKYCLFSDKTASVPVWCSSASNVSNYYLR